MIARWWLVPIVLLLVSGCSYPSFNVPAKEYRSKVRTLGVLPLLVDADSDIHHHQGAQVISLLESHNRAADMPLVEMLRNQKGYFDVRLLREDTRELFGQLVSGSQVSGQGAELRLDYDFRVDTAARLIDAHQVDALLVVVLHGIVRTERRWDRAALAVTYLDAPLNLVTVSAYVVDAQGGKLWQLSAERAGTFLDLQYPKFDEAYYNRSDQVATEYLRLEGLENALEVKSEQALPSETLAEPYWSLFRRIVADLDPGRPGLFRQ
ncbi:MAG: hypothetical protein C0624_14885 [Desulfuromonas sp.]|nr:MAG: hypothetical protein C0624_14885 [Desulfuromonas sp.]